jgi:hypothetical protein
VEREFYGIKSAKLKVGRAFQSIKLIDSEVAKYVAEHPYEIIAEAEGTQKVKVHREPDPIISVVSGEVIYHLRSALDNLIFDLIKLNPSGIQLPAKWFEHCGFPFIGKVPEGRNTPLLKSDFHNLPGIADEPFAFIESLQPYNTGYLPEFMRIISHLSNVDKHRHLNVTVGAVTALEYINSEPITFLGSTYGTEFDLPANVQGYTADMNVKRELSAFVMLKESVGSKALSLPYILSDCLRAVAVGIIPRFEKFLG